MWQYATAIILRYNLFIVQRIIAKPKMPTESEIKGLSTFTGQQIHSHNYRTPFFCKNKRVVVAGLGISGGEIYGEVCEVTPHVIGSSHR